MQICCSSSERSLTLESVCGSGCVRVGTSTSHTNHLARLQNPQAALTPREPSGRAVGLFFFLSECRDQSAATQRAATASPLPPSASHGRGRSGAKKHRVMGVDGSFSLWVKTNISFFYYLDRLRVVFAQRYHNLESGMCSD